jgi:hydrogenase-4 component B
VTAPLLLAAVALAAASGVPGLFLRRPEGAGERLAAAMLGLAAMIGITGALRVLFLGDAVLDAAWPVPGGRFSVHADAVSAMFFIQIFLVSSLGAVYGLAYWPQREHRDDGRKLRFFYGLLTAGLALIVVAGSSVLFLAAWELMAISAFFVVTTEDREPAVRQSGLVYLVATRASTLCLFAFFALLHAQTGGHDFAIPAGVTVSPAARDALFVLALVGFGLKAGIMPLHLWLPGAHANAPSHVSALMSGVLIKMGIYGLIRVTALFPDPPLWWGGLLVALGAASGILGVAFAIGQHDLKRLLAYHSVENIGIIVIGLGLALVGRSTGSATLLTLGLAGALLHTWNHGLFKALLFLSAGAVVHATRTRDIDALGGLAKAMPRTALAFIVGAVAISGLPPLNGFVSELLLYVGMLRDVAAGAGRGWLASAAGIAALALIGALAVACFVKVLGAVFLGTPRTEHARHAREPPPAMLAPMAVLGAACVAIGLYPPLVAPILDRAVAAWAPRAVVPAIATIAPLREISITGILLLAAVLIAALALRALARRAPQSTSGTWDCGYLAPAPTMQYTSSSFAEILVGFFAWALRPTAHRPHLREPFPRPAAFHSHVPDVVLDRLVLPGFAAMGRFFGWFRWVQQGSVHAYLLYILITLVICFVWWR